MSNAFNQLLCIKFCFFVFFHDLYSGELHSLATLVQTLTIRTHHATSTQSTNLHFLHIPLSRIKFHWDSYFSRTFAIWNGHPRGCFPDNYNRNLFKSRNKSYLFLIVCNTFPFLHPILYSSTLRGSWAWY